MNIAYPATHSDPKDDFIEKTVTEELAHYYRLSMEEIHARGEKIKKELGEDLLILCHHYQQDDTFHFHDVSGDSLYLSRQAAATPAKYVVFCGVHFMAEAADIVTSDDQIVMLPDLTAGCSMADMADLPTVENAWEQIEQVCGKESVIPITYINSEANLKAFCGKHGGTVCTSSNSQKILKWALDQNKKVLFFPDQHLGRNTANALGVASEQIVLWERERKLGGLENDTLHNAKVILWDGYCSVHCRFTTESIKQYRKEDPNVNIIVHPECPEEIVNAADFSGSTDHIIKTVSAADPGSRWIVGTEINLVNRMAQRLKKEKNIDIECLNPTACRCSTMYQIYPGDVLWVLENIAEGNVINQVKVPEDTKFLAKQALETMLSLSA